MSLRRGSFSRLLTMRAPKRNDRSPKSFYQHPELTASQKGTRTGLMKNPTRSGGGEKKNKKKAGKKTNLRKTTKKQQQKHIKTPDFMRVFREVSKVQFARFGYKGANEWAGTSAGKVKLTSSLAAK